MGTKVQWGARVHIWLVVLLWVLLLLTFFGSSLIPALQLQPLSILSWRILLGVLLLTVCATGSVTLMCMRRGSFGQTFAPANTLVLGVLLSVGVGFFLQHLGP